MEEKTVEEITFDLKVNSTKTVKGLREGQDEIVSSIEKLSNKIDNDLENHSKELAKGSDKFKELFSTVSSIQDEVKDMKSQISEGFNDIKKEFSNHIEKSQNQKIDELNKKLDAKSSVKNGIIVTLVGGIVLAACLYILQSLVPVLAK